MKKTRISDIVQYIIQFGELYIDQEKSSEDWGNKKPKFRTPKTLKNTLRLNRTENINLKRDNAMHIWTLDNWGKYYNLDDEDHRTGLRLRFEKGVDNEIKRACKEFTTWLRKEYFFPQRVVIYFKTAEFILSKDKEKCSATIFMPYDRLYEPYIRIAIGDVNKLEKKWGKDEALAAVLCSMAHELTHYFQWINGIELTKIGKERQATMYAGYILDEYAETREHP